MNSPAIKVFLLDDHPTMLWGLEQIINSRGSGMNVVGKASSCDEALPRVAELQPDVILLDMDLGSESGIDAIPRLFEHCQAKVLVLTGLRDQATLDKAVLAGARGVVQKDAQAEVILNAVVRVYEGQIWLDRMATGRLFMEFSKRGATTEKNPEQEKIDSLTERERRIVGYLLADAGASAKAVADKLFISENTLRNHLTSIYRKLEVANRLELLAYAQRHQITL